MKIFKLLGLTSTLALATIPFVLSTKHEIVRCDYGTPIGNKVNEIKKEVDEIKKEINSLKNKIDKAQLCKIKKDIDELKKIVYALIGVVGGSGALVGGTNLIKKKK